MTAFEVLLSDDARPAGNRQHYRQWHGHPGRSACPRPAGAELDITIKPRMTTVAAANTDLASTRSVCRDRQLLEVPSHREDDSLADVRDSVRDALQVMGCPEQMCSLIDR